MPPNGMHVLVFAVCVGIIGAVQTVVNNRAGEHFESFLIGSWIEFAGGVVCILLFVGGEMVVKGSKQFMRFSRYPRWTDFVPGTISMIFVCAMVGLTSVTGFSLFFIGAVVGQLLASTVFDQFGLCGGLKMPINFQKVVAIIIGVGGAVLSAVQSLTDSSSEYSEGAVGACVALAVGAGTLLPLQAAMNRQLSDALPSKMQTTLFSFSVGLVICTVAVGIQLGVNKELAADVLPNIKSSVDAIWLYFGGPGGMLYISSGIFFIRTIGAAPFFVALICGQLAGGALMDATGFLGARVIESGPMRIVGVCTVILASILMQVQLPAAWTAPCDRLCNYRRYQAVRDLDADEEAGLGMHKAPKQKGYGATEGTPLLLGAAPTAAAAS